VIGTRERKTQDVTCKSKFRIYGSGRAEEPFGAVDGSLPESGEGQKDMHLTQVKTKGEDTSRREWDRDETAAEDQRDH